ncbi:MAG: tyrosine-type recombinase/integrase [Ktedonobacteraceae bacterium]
MARRIANHDDKSKRSPRGEGSVYQRSDGRWVAQVTLEDGKRKLLYRKTEKEALSALRKALNEQEKGTLATGPQQTLKAYLTHWLEEVHKPTIRLSTYVKYHKLINTYIIPVLGYVQLQKLTPQQVLSLYRQKEKEGLSSKTINSIHGVLHKALDNAVRWNLISRNVCDLVSPPRIIKREAQTLTMEQAQKLLEAAHGQRLEVPLKLALTTGMRRGELLGLKWADIDFENRFLQVRRTLDFIASYGGYVETEPKTAKGRRKIMLPDLAIQALKQHRAQQEEWQLKAGEKWQGKDYVFTGLEGGPLNPRYILKLFAKLLKEAGLPHMHFHDLRHSAATLLLSMGVHPKVVQEILGHSNISMTMDIYSHVLPSMHKEAMDKWDDAFGTD